MIDGTRLRYNSYRVHFNSKRWGLLKVRQILTFLTVANEITSLRIKTIWIYLLAGAYVWSPSLASIWSRETISIVVIANYNSWSWSLFQKFTGVHQPFEKKWSEVESNDLLPPFHSVTRQQTSEPHTSAHINMRIIIPNNICKTPIWYYLFRTILNGHGFLK